MSCSGPPVSRTASGREGAGHNVPQRAEVHTEFEINQVWGGPNSGIDGGNDGGKGITDTPGGLKLQCEGHDVRYRNTGSRS